MGSPIGREVRVGCGEGESLPHGSATDAWAPPWSVDATTRGPKKTPTTQLAVDAYGWEVAPVGFATAKWIEQMGGGDVLERHAARVGLRDRSRCASWIRRLVTKTGKNRWPRVRGCGRLAAAYCRDLELDGVAPLWCRDRSCSVCTARHARKNAAKLDLHAQARGLHEAGLHMITLTQPRLRELPGAATDRLNHSMRLTTHSAAGRKLFPKGTSLIRTLEVTWSPTPKGDWHPHFHILAVATEEWAHDVVALWLKKSGGARAAQHVRRADKGSTLEVLKYAVKGIEGIPGERAAELFGALAGRRLITATGEWSGWRDAGHKLPVMALGQSIDALQLDAIGMVERWISQGRTLPEIVAAEAGVPDEVVDAVESLD